MKDDGCVVAGSSPCRACGLAARSGHACVTPERGDDARQQSLLQEEKTQSISGGGDEPVTHMGRLE